MNTKRPPVVAASLAFVLVLGACGGDDTADDPTEPIDTVADEPAADEPAEEPADVEGPESTVPADVPEEFVGSIGPMDIDGEYLPVLATDDIDADEAVGTAAPVVVGVDLDGNPVRIDAAADGPTMVVFLAHWCPHCNAEIPVFNELRDEGRFPEDLNIVAVSTSPDPGRPNFPPSEWIADMDWTYPVVAEGVDLELSPPWLAAEAFGVSGFPFVTLIDDEGNVAARWSGEQDPDETIATIEERLGL